jgi:hypothetical protein
MRFEAIGACCSRRALERMASCLPFRRLSARTVDHDVRTLEGHEILPIDHAGWAEGRITGRGVTGRHIA